MKKKQIVSALFACAFAVTTLFVQLPEKVSASTVGSGTSAAAAETSGSSTYPTLKAAANGSGKLSLVKSSSKVVAPSHRIDNKYTVGPTTTKPITIRNGKLFSNKSTSIPSSYDSRTYNKITSVKDQGVYGDCWAYATLGSLEATLMPNENRDFDETDIAENSGFGTTLDSGGNYLMSTAYLARWSGPLNQGASSGVQKHVQDVDWLPSRQDDETTVDQYIKTEVMQYGALYTSININEDYYDYVYNSSTASYYDFFTSDEYLGNHAVDIVGWDDNYSASNFVYAPSRNGAFICKNSWGTGFGKSGYFYVSYDDLTIGLQLACFDDAESTSNYSNIYQDDDTGFIGSCFTSTEGMANIFTAQDSNPISAAGFYTLETGDSYSVYVLPNCSGINDIASGKNAVQVASGTQNYAGYHTVSFSQKVSVTAGESYAVLVVLSNSSFSNGVESAISQTTVPDGESFIIYANNVYDVGGYGDICIKAFSSTAVSTPTLSISNPVASRTYYGGVPVSGSATSSAGIAKVTLTVDRTLLSTITSFGSDGSFSYTLPATITTGKHTLIVTATGKDGGTSTKNVALIMGASKTCIDSPAQNANNTGNLTVKGWAVSPTGVSEVDVYLDKGSSAQKSYAIKSFTSRPDVQKAVYPYGTYPTGDKCGYAITIPSQSISSGKHTLTVVSISKNGSQQASGSFSEAQPLPSKMCLDTPTSSIQYGNVNVSGWALDGSGESQAVITIDPGAYTQKSYTTSVNQPRADVKKAKDPNGLYPGSDNCGFTYAVPASDLIVGMHTVNVTVIAKNGSKQSVTSSFTVGPIAQMYVDSLSKLSTGNLLLKGWALNHAGISRVDVYIDFGMSSQKYYSTSQHYARPDVKKALDPQGHYVNSANCGYQVAMPLSDFSTGTHTLYVAAIGNDGSVQWSNRYTFTLN